MLGTLLTAAVALQPIEGIRTRANSLETVAFHLPQGEVRVYLPDDLSQGDTVSGTVFTLPAPNATENDQSVLKGMVVTLDRMPGERKDDHRKWIVPASAAGYVMVRLTRPDGSVVGSAPVPTGPPVGAFLQGQPPSMDPVVQQGRPMQVTGPFDGDSGNTSCNVAGVPVPILAESPRQAVAFNPQIPVGAFVADVTEAGVKTPCPSHAIGIRLTTPKTQLLRGEKTTVKVEVTGLQGLSAASFPVPVQFLNMTPQVVSAEGWQGHIHSQGIEMADVKNGVWQTSIALTGINNGNFLLKGVLFGVNVHDAKKLMNAEMFRTWVTGLVTMYETKIKALEEELAKDKAAGRKNPGLELNIQRKKNILSILREARTATNADLGVMKVIVDKALKDDEFFALAGELISLAADMLGYTDIPIPGIGTLLKGTKAFVSKFPKVIKAIEAAEKLVEEYEKLKDAADKVKKAEEIKEALEKVKDALDDED